MLGKEAFTAAADPQRFPEQLKYVQPWQAKRLFWNVFRFTREHGTGSRTMKNRIDVDVGDFDPVLGKSYAEIAGISRSMHRSQGMGAPERRGSSRETFVVVAGEQAQKDLFDGIDLSWNRVPGGAEVGRHDRAGHRRSSTRCIPTASFPICWRRAGSAPGERTYCRELMKPSRNAPGYGWTPTPTATPSCRAKACKVKLTALDRSSFRFDRRTATVTGPGAGVQARFPQRRSVYNKPAEATVTYPIPPIRSVLAAVLAGEAEAGRYLHHRRSASHRPARLRRLCWKRVSDSPPAARRSN